MLEQKLSTKVWWKNFLIHRNLRVFLLLWKCVYPYEYMDDWEKFNETSLPEKKDFYSHSNMEYITNADTHKRKDFEIKYLGEYNDLSVQSNTFLLANIVKNFRNMCLQKYKLNPAKFPLTPGLA